MRVGLLEILPVHDGRALVPASEALRRIGNTNDQAWKAHQQFLVDGTNLDLALGGFLVRIGSRVVLVDLGVGNINRPPFVGGEMLNSLRAYGVEPADVTDVLFTHLHFDHVGWATQQGNVVFQNAVHRCHRADWDHFVGGGDGKAAAKMAPLTDRMEFWETDCTLAPGLDVVGAPGHTPGSTIMVVSSGAEKAMLLGDVVHCPVELVEDDWEALFDVDPALARTTRETLARELEGMNVQLAAAHFPGLEFGRLLQGTPVRSFVYS
jgi:glyoxylase-like metal-dependent hydrolase (beta-lactamase superfamily II)